MILHLVLGLKFSCYKIGSWKKKTLLDLLPLPQNFTIHSFLFKIQNTALCSVRAMMVLTRLTSHAQPPPQPLSTLPRTLP